MEIGSLDSPCGNQLSFLAPVLLVFLPKASSKQRSIRSRDKDPRKDWGQKCMGGPGGPLSEESFFTLFHCTLFPLLIPASGSQGDTEQVALAGAWAGGRLGRMMLVSIWAKGTHGPQFPGTGGEQARADELLSNRVGNFSPGTFQR